MVVRRKPVASGRFVGGVHAADPTTPRSRLRGAGVVLLWSASLAGLSYGLYRLEPLAAASSGPGTWRLDWATPPSADDAWILDHVEPLVAPLRGMNVRDPELCARLGTELARSPWIAKVERVNKRSDGVVTVHATFRKYLTFVVKDGMGYLVDDTGVRLPRQEPRDRLAEHGRVLVEGTREALPEVGQVWPGEDVRAGLKLVKFLNERCPAPLLACLKAVDVSNHKLRLKGLDPELAIRTIHPRTRILWGHPPGEEYDTEATADRKLLRYLWTIYVKDNQLPDRKVIDLRDRNEPVIEDAK